MVLSPFNVVVVGEVCREGGEHLVVRNGRLSRRPAVLLQAIPAEGDPAQALTCDKISGKEQNYYNNLVDTGEQEEEE